MGEEKRKMEPFVGFGRIGVMELALFVGLLV